MDCGAWQHATKLNTISDVSSCVWLSDLSVQTSCHMEYNCEDLYFFFLSVLLWRFGECLVCINLCKVKSSAVEQEYSHIYVTLVWLFLFDVCVFSSDLLWRMILCTLHNHKVSHQCGLADVFLSYLLERMSSYSLYSGEALKVLALVNVFWQENTSKCS